ncbi:MAG: serine protease Do [Myxococcota bacterium]|jgi:serine protease Do
MRIRLLPLIAFVCFAALAMAQQLDHQNERFTTEARVYLSSGPSVVNIGVYAVRLGPSEVLNMESIPQSSTQISQGTGVIIDERGLVITNAHVVSQATNLGTIVYQLTFGEQFKRAPVSARLLSVDIQSDLALLKIIDKGNYPPIVFAKEDDLMIGEKVIAIGSPLGNAHSLTSGILSGIHRDINVTTGRGQTIRFKGLIQTDAAINFGNSGGPLLNSLGELIGINNATAQSADGIGYAIPIQQVNKILQERLRRPRVWLGVVLESDDDLTVSQMHPRSPSLAQGLSLNDTILSVNGIEVASLEELNSELLLIDSGEKFEIEIERAQRFLHLEISLPSIGTRDTIGLLGLTGRPSTLRYTDENGWPRRSRVVEIITVINDSPAAKLKLQVGDAIHAVRLNDTGSASVWTPVSSMAQLVALLKNSKFVRDDFNILWSSKDGSYHQGQLTL